LRILAGFCLGHWGGGQGNAAGSIMGNGEGEVQEKTRALLMREEKGEKTVVITTWKKRFATRTKGKAGCGWTCGRSNT